MGYWFGSAAVSEIASEETLGFGDGVRIVSNNGLDGGKEVIYLHKDALSGKKDHATVG